MSYKDRPNKCENINRQDVGLWADLWRGSVTAQQTASWLRRNVADADDDEDDHSVFVYKIMQIYKPEQVWSTKYIGYTTSVANMF